MAADFEVETAHLVERFCGGDEAAVAEVLRVFGPALRAFLRRTFGGLIREEIDQITLDAVEAAHECRTNYDAERGPFLAWSTGIAYHLAVKYLRSLTANGQPFEIATAPHWLSRMIDRRGSDAQGAEKFDLAERDRLLHRALNALNDVQRQVLLADACAREALSSRQLGGELGLPDSTVRCARQRGKAALRALLLDLGIEAFVFCNTPGEYTNSESPSDRASNANSRSWNGEAGSRY